ncbi:hypothetical protein ACVR1I_03725 [Streptococcus cameli]
MAFVLNEEMVEKMVAEVNEANPAFQFDWKNYAFATHPNGRSSTNHIFLENHTYFGIIEIGTFDVSQITDFELIEKSEIQGLKVRKGLLNIVLKIRTYNGEFYKFYLNKKGSKRLPLHSENVEKYWEHFQNDFVHQTDMKDRNSSIGNRLWSILAWIIGIPVGIAVGVLTDTYILGAIAWIVCAFGIGWLAERFEIGSAKRKDKAFFQEVEGLTAQYAQGDPAIYYHELKKIQHLPQTPIYQAQYYQMLISLAYELDKLDEGKEYLTHFPRRYSEGTENLYQGLVNLLATPKEIPSPEFVEEADALASEPTLSEEVPEAVILEEATLSDPEEAGLEEMAPITSPELPTVEESHVVENHFESGIE